MPSSVHPWRLRYHLALAVGLAAALVSTTLAHGWEEVDPRLALAEADAVLDVAAAVQGSWSTVADDPSQDAHASWPAELRWWRWLEARLAERGSADVVAAIQERAPAWLAETRPSDAVAWWFDALAEIVAHAAARSVDAAMRTEAAEVLGRPDAGSVEAELASWLVVLPSLTDAERRELAPAFARLDALVASVQP